MVRGRRSGDRAQALDVGEHLGRVGRVPAHELPLGRRQLAGLVEDGVRNAELSEVVQQSRPAQVAELATAPRPRTRADAGGGLGDALGVARGEGRLGVDHATERLGDQVEPVVVGEDDALGGLERGDVRRDVGRRDVLPEGGVAGDVLEQVGERAGRTRCRAGAPYDVGGGLRAAGREEDLGGLGKTHDPRRAGRSRRRGGRRVSRARPSARRPTPSRRPSRRGTRAGAGSARRGRSAARPSSSPRRAPLRATAATLRRGRPGDPAVEPTMWRTASDGRFQSIRLRPPLKSRSSPPRSCDTRAAVLEQPTSFRRRA